MKIKDFLFFASEPVEEDASAMGMNRLYARTVADYCTRDVRRKKKRPTKGHYMTTS